MKNNPKSGSNAKKHPDFYRTVWRLHLCGNDAPGIAETLETSQPTVRRTLKRIREQRSPNVLRILFDAAREAGVADILVYDRCTAVLSTFYHGQQAKSFQTFHDCLTGCARRLGPREFVKKHIIYHAFELGPYALNFADFKDPSEATAEIDKFRFCRSCPMGGYLMDAMRPYQTNHYLYAQTMVYFASTRLRNVDERDLMLMHFDVLIIQMIHDIILRRIQSAAMEGLDKDGGLAATEKAFRELTATIWDDQVRFMGSV